MLKKKVEAIDLFCGIGGLSYGLQKSGIKVLAGLDSDTTCAYAFEKNIEAKFIHANIETYDFSKMHNLYSRNAIRLLVGCAPCQPFSSHSFKNKKKKVDLRWSLINYFLHAVEILQPHIISMENVAGFVKVDVFDNFVSVLRKNGYFVIHKIVNCADYGVPQNRRRLVLLASQKEGISIPLAQYTPKQYIPIRNVIKKLPKITHGDGDVCDKMHKSKKLYPINIERIKQSRQSGTWKDWDASLLPNCYRKKSGASFTSVYGRMSWEKISPTITTQFYNYGSGRFGHPEQDRGLSLREGALLQSFPMSYDFGTILFFSNIGRHIGNAVPPKLGEAIGRQILSHIGEHYE